MRISSTTTSSTSVRHHGRRSLDVLCPEKYWLYQTWDFISRTHIAPCNDVRRLQRILHRPLGGRVALHPLNAPYNPSTADPCSHLVEPAAQAPRHPVTSRSIPVCTRSTSRTSTLNPERPLPTTTIRRVTSSHSTPSTSSASLSRPHWGPRKRALRARKHADVVVRQCVAS
ncbi:hypothetical protein BV25DRAFT_1309049 [Artomyces pyxidatus]|uniref:Uncharacterized protein n=1 Tax=Artomyces pyxidatus TaxID=48021 RepID=A0ACB8SPC1_9AGAM|nr:hypothetical protein BV25DRAFT_1309049 [Artomyces pyxidatus]